MAANPTLRIMNVDDDPAGRYALSRLLKSEGFYVIEAANGGQALAKLKEKPDLIILDVRLPDLSGFEVCRRIKANPDNAATPVLLISASYKDDQSKVEGFECGADGYLTRPIELPVLSAYVKALLRLRKAEDELISKALELRSTFDAITDGIYLVDSSGSVIRSNKTMALLCGKSLEDVLGSKSWELMPDDSKCAQGDALAAALGNGGRVTRTTRAWDRWFRVTVDPVRDGDGSVKGAVHVVSDITEGKRNEEALNQYRTNLEELVEKRTAELKAANELLRQEIKEREKAENAKKFVETELEQQRVLSLRADRLRSLGEMAAGMAHELNQPLCGVRGLAEHLLIAYDRGWDMRQDEIRKKLMLVVEQADRMSHIVEHTRMFAREAGRREMKSVSVNSVIHTSIGMLGEEFRRHGLSLTLQLAEGLPPVRANPYSLEEVVLNLMSNARDAMRERLKAGPDLPNSVILSTRLDGKDRSRPVTIQIQDFGVGIPQELLPKVMEPFFTTKGSEEGTGLGLAICKTIVEDLGGTITIYSDEGQGTIVAISLPAAKT